MPRGRNTESRKTKTRMKNVRQSFAEKHGLKNDPGYYKRQKEMEPSCKDLIICTQLTAAHRPTLATHFPVFSKFVTDKFD